MRKHLLNGTVALSLALSACSLAPNYQRPRDGAPHRLEQRRRRRRRRNRTQRLFWQDLGSAELDRLIDQALAQNLDLEAALHRIEQARAQAKIAARRFTRMSAPAARLRAPFKIRKDTNRRAAAAASATKSTFGARIVTRRSPPTIGSTPAEFDREALRLVVTSDATNFYAQVLSLNDRIRIAEFNLKNAEEILRIIEARFAQGSVSGLEVSQQRVAVNGFRTALATLVEQRSTTANALAILLGLAPQNFSTPSADARDAHTAAGKFDAAGNTLDRAPGH